MKKLVLTCIGVLLITPSFSLGYMKPYFESNLVNHIASNYQGDIMAISPDGIPFLYSKDIDWFLPSCEDYYTTWNRSASKLIGAHDKFYLLNTVQKQIQCYWRITGKWKTWNIDCPGSMLQSEIAYIGNQQQLVFTCNNVLYSIDYFNANYDCLEDTFPVQSTLVGLPEGLLVVTRTKLVYRTSDLTNWQQIQLDTEETTPAVYFFNSYIAYDESNLYYVNMNDNSKQTLLDGEVTLIQQNKSNPNIWGVWSDNKLFIYNKDQQLAVYDIDSAIELSRANSDFIANQSKVFLSGKSSKLYQLQGNTFAPFSKGLNYGGSVIHVNNINRQEMIYLTRGGQYLRSDNQGQTWAEINLPKSWSTFKEMFQDYHGRLWHFQPDSIFTSTDFGDSWTRIKPINSPIQLQMGFIPTFDPDTASNVWITFGGGLSKSTDNGATWQTAVPEPVAQSTWTYVFFFHITPKPRTMIIQSNQSGYASRIWRSLDNGQTWSFCDDMLLSEGQMPPIKQAWSNGQRLYIELDYWGVYVSSNYGANWSIISQQPLGTNNYQHTFTKIGDAIAIFRTFNGSYSDASSNFPYLSYWTKDGPLWNQIDVDLIKCYFPFTNIFVTGDGYNRELIIGNFHDKLITADIENKTPDSVSICSIKGTWFVSNLIGASCLKIFDLQGSLVKSLQLPKSQVDVIIGQHQLAQLTSGVYFVVAESKNQRFFSAKVIHTR